MRILLLVAVALVLLGLLPILSMLVASVVAFAAGCDLHEGDVNSCVVLGADLGEALYRMFVAGWFAYLTLPVGLVGVALFLVWGAVALVRLLRR